MTPPSGRRNQRGLGTIALVPGFVICFAPNFTVPRSELVLFNMSQLDVTNHSIGQELFYDEQGMLLHSMGLSVRSNIPFGVIQFFIDSTKADALVSFPDTIAIRGTMSPSAHNQRMRRGTGRLTRIRKEIVLAIFSALRTTSKLPTAPTIGSDFRDFLENVEQITDTSYLRTFDLLFSILHHQRDNVFCGFINFPS